jgi:hypothetical protein
MKFKAPVYIGDEVVATLRITGLDTDQAAPRSHATAQSTARRCLKARR